MAEKKSRQLNRPQIEAYLKSATQDLIPDVLDKIDLSTPQINDEYGSENTPFIGFVRRRAVAALVAACFCLITLAGGTYTYQNGKVDSVIGIDVNPSVELSINRKNQILEAKALNEDAKSILGDMNLKGVDLNVAVNAVVGSMVTHGYLNDLDNAILVTVSNDSIKKATDLRAAVVNDIHQTLEEKKLKAVVYDQQVIEEDEVKRLSDDYEISYGKAYFLNELIAQNPSLSMEDMKELAPLTMEEIAKVITERSYAVGGKTKVKEEITENETNKPSTISEIKTTKATTLAEETTQETATSSEQTQASVQTTPAQTMPVATVPPTEGTSEAVVSEGNIKIDYVDFEDSMITVNFETKVKWKNPTILVRDEDGNTYSSKFESTGSYACEIKVSGLSDGVQYTFVLGGISPKIGRQTTVKGVFETPVIGIEDIEETSESDDNKETNQTEETEESKETKASESTAEAMNQSDQASQVDQSEEKSTSQEENIVNSNLPEE